MAIEFTCDGCGAASQMEDPVRLPLGSDEPDEEMPAEDWMAETRELGLYLMCGDCHETRKQARERPPTAVEVAAALRHAADWARTNESLRAAEALWWGTHPDGDFGSPGGCFMCRRCRTVVRAFSLWLIAAHKDQGLPPAPSVKDWALSMPTPDVLAKCLEIAAEDILAGEETWRTGPPLGSSGKPIRWRA